MSDCKILQGKEAHRIGQMPFGKRYVLMQARAGKCSNGKKKGGRL